MKILSWNILADEFIKKRYYPMIPPEDLMNRVKRQKHIIHTLKQCDTDVMLLQEVMQSEYNALSQAFAKTYHLIRGKNITWQNKRGYSGNVTCLRKSLFTVPTGVPLAFGVGINCFYKQQPLLIFNIHLDDASRETRLTQLNELLPALRSNTKIIVAGDFNENYEAKNKLYHLLQTAGLKIMNRQPTYYIEKKMCIDNILTKGLTWKHNAAQVVNDFGADVVKQFMTYGSDHLPVILN